MIPRIIHYFWFGGAPLSEMAQNCIASWRKYLPDYEIKEWNETNFDVNVIPFTAEAYKLKKYAFVSDYARLWVLYEYGGLYLDIDVEMIQSPYSIIGNGPFFGTEKSVANNNDLLIAAGSLFGVEPKMNFIKSLLSDYESSSFAEITINKKITDKFISAGWKRKNEISYVDDFVIYPVSYFSPVDWRTKKIKKTKNTYCIHWFNGSWTKSGIMYRVKTLLLTFIPDTFLIKYFNWKFKKS